MSRVRKNIQNTFDEVPEITDKQSIVKVVATRGTNQIEVEYPITRERILVILPTKFNKLIWVKKGDFVIISTDLSEQNKGKIKGFVDHILVAQQVKELKKTGKWPAEFDDDEATADDDTYEGNPNRVAFSDSEEEEDDDSEEDDE